MKGKTNKKLQRKGGRGYRKSRRKSRKSQTKKQLVGGTNNLGLLPIRYYYPYNKNPDYLMEPITGGKKKKKRLRCGGGGLLSSFGSVVDLQNASLLTGEKSLINSSLVEQPASQVF
jgi:hypothetical protein